MRVSKVTNVFAKTLHVQSTAQRNVRVFSFPVSSKVNRQSQILGDVFLIKFFILR